MVMYDYDNNEILAENRQAVTIHDDLLKTRRILKSIGSDSEVYIMDNECSSGLKVLTKITKLTSNWIHHTSTDEIQQTGKL